MGFERYLELLGTLLPLYEEVATSRVFEDGKTIVDMPLIDSPESIIVQFNELLRQKALVSPEEWKSILLKFVKERFGTAGEDMVECSPNPASACARPMTWNDELLASMWTLCRKAYSSQSGSNCIRSTLIPAPYPFVIPGERFRESYYWDSYWILRGLLAQDDEVSDVALGILRNFSYMIRQTGMIPNGFRSYYLNRSQPPMFTSMVYIMYQHTKSMDIITEFLPAVKSELLFWRSGERSLKVLNPNDPSSQITVTRYHSSWTNPRPESFREDLETFSKFKDEMGPSWDALPAEEKMEMRKMLFTDICAAAESGWDFSSRWLDESNSLSSIRTTKVLPVDLNALLLKSEYLLSEMAKVVGDKEIQGQFSEFYQERLEALDNIFWDDARSKWRDVIVDNDNTPACCGFAREEDYASDWVPLWCMSHLADSRTESFTRAIASLKNSKINAVGGIAASSVYTGQQWDWPNVWPPLQYFLAEGFRSMKGNLESMELSDSIEERYLDSCKIAWKARATLPEKFDCEMSGGLGFGGEYECVQGFGWTTGLALHWSRMTSDTTPPVYRYDFREDKADDAY